jgi:hypothetical protein
MKIVFPYNISESNLEIYTKTMPYLKSILQSQPRGFYDNDNHTNIAVHVRRGDVSATHNDGRYTSSEIFFTMIHKLNILYSNCSIYIFTELTKDNKNEFNEIVSNYTNVFLKADLDVISTFNYLTQADVLVLSISSFSHLAALYNTKGTVYATNFWHKSLDNWLHVEDLLK